VFKEYLPYYKRNLKVALPVMLTQLGASLVGLFDSIMVGHYATVDLAAVSFSNAIFFTVMVFAMGALMGLTPLVGFQVGSLTASESEQSNSVSGLTSNNEHCEQSDSPLASSPRSLISSLFQNGMLFTVLLSIFTLVLLGGCIPFLDCFGQDPAVVEAARPYYILIVISIIPFLFFTFFKQFLEGLGNTSVAMVITLLMNGLNIFLNWLFIYGNWGCPELGATGAGVGSLVARVGMPICFVAVMYYRKEWKGYLKAMRIANFRKSVIKELAKIGFPIGVQTLMETIAFTAAFVFIGWISKEALAAHQIANQICDMTFMVILGIGSATTIRVSHQLGAKNLEGVRMASNASIHLVLLINAIGAAVMIGFRNYIPLLFTKDPEVIAIASQLVVLAGVLQLADGLQVVAASMLRGITDVKVPMIIAMFSYTIVCISIGLFLAFPMGMGAVGIWIGFVLGLSVAAVCLHTRFRIKFRDLELQIG
jgi:MATE family multidrug resistance protein